MVIYGDKMKYLVALVTLNPDEAKKFADHNGLENKSYEEIAKQPEMQEMVNQVIKEKNSTLAGFLRRSRNLRFYQETSR